MTGWYAPDIAQGKPWILHSWVHGVLAARRTRLWQAGLGLAVGWVFWAEFGALVLGVFVQDRVV